jgi:DNA end-binding protein Ku
MKTEWNPDAFKDDYEKALKDLIDRKLSGKKITATKEPTKRPSNVIDLVDVLRQSLNQKGSNSSSSKPAKKKPAQASSRRAGVSHSGRKAA